MVLSFFFSLCGIYSSSSSSNISFFFVLYSFQEELLFTFLLFILSFKFFIFLSLAKGPTKTLSRYFSISSSSVIFFFPCFNSLNYFSIIKLNLFFKAFSVRPSNNFTISAHFFKPFRSFTDFKRRMSYVLLQGPFFKFGFK